MRRRRSLKPAAEPQIEFSADQVIYDSDADVVTAQGQVRMARDGNYLAADRVSWDRKTGRVVAEGNVVVVNPEGDKLIGDRVDLTDIAARRHGRESADRAGKRRPASRPSGDRAAATQTELVNAVYSACPVTTETGCPKNPSWKITAARVIQDSTTGRIRFAGGRLTILGVTLPLLPVFSIGDGSQKGGFSGALVPGIRIDSNNGLELSLPYYWRFDRNRDLTVTPAYLHRLAACAGGALAAPDFDRRLSDRRLRHLWRHSGSRPDRPDTRPTARASAAISKPMAASSSIPTGP